MAACDSLGRVPVVGAGKGAVGGYGAVEAGLWGAPAPLPGGERRHTPERGGGVVLLVAGGPPPEPAGAAHLPVQTKLLKAKLARKWAEVAWTCSLSSVILP